MYPKQCLRIRPNEQFPIARVQVIVYEIEIVDHLYRENVSASSICCISCTHRLFPPVRGFCCFREELESFCTQNRIGNLYPHLVEIKMNKPRKRYVKISDDQAKGQV